MWRQTWIILMSAWIGLDALAGSTQCFAQGDAQSPQETIELLLSLRHGLAERMMDEETKRLLQKVTQDPATYVEPLSAVLELPEDDADLVEPALRRRAGGALALAQRLGHTHTREMVRRFFGDTSRRARSLEEQQAPDMPIQAGLRNLRLLRNSALGVLGEFGDSYAVDTCLATVEFEDMAAHVVMMDYFSKVGQGNEKLKKALQRMIDQPQSELSRGPYVRRALAAIQKSAKHKSVDRKTASHPATHEAEREESDTDMQKGEDQHGGTAGREQSNDPKRDPEGDR